MTQTRDQTRPETSASAPAEPQAQLPRLTLAALALLSALSPFATDMYLSAFPKMATELKVPGSSIQLTLTAFFVGLASGQLIIGPLSDRYGRRRPLIIGSVACLLAGLVTAVAPNVAVLGAARIVQGFGGAAGVVLARAVVTDRARGIAAARLFSLMMLIGGVAPIIAPMLGTAVGSVVGWRGIMWVLVALTAVMVIGVLAAVPESLPPQRRHRGGATAFLTTLRVVLTSRRFVGYGLTVTLSFAGMFAYISASPFVLQNVLGLSTLEYSLAFGANALGVSICSAVSARLVGRVPARRLLLTGLASLLTATSLLAVEVVLLGCSRWPTLVLLWWSVASLGLVFGNGTALAIQEVRAAAGTGSALLGATQFTFGALVSPLVGLRGDHDALPMAVTFLVAAVAALLAAVVVAGKDPNAARQSLLQRAEGRSGA
jgi:MFS transporter, DHA1 family, multidrug resistance protein